MALRSSKNNFSNWYFERIPSVGYVASPLVVGLSDSFEHPITNPSYLKR